MNNSSNNKVVTWEDLDSHLEKLDKELEIKKGIGKEDSVSWDKLEDHLDKLAPEVNSESKIKNDEPPIENKEDTTGKPPEETLKKEENNSLKKDLVQEKANPSVTDEISFQVPEKKNNSIDENEKPKKDEFLVLGSGKTNKETNKDLELDLIAEEISTAPSKGKEIPLTIESSDMPLESSYGINLNSNLGMNQEEKEALDRKPQMPLDSSPISSSNLEKEPCLETNPKGNLVSDLEPKEALASKTNPSTSPIPEATLSLDGDSKLPLKNSSNTPKSTEESNIVSEEKLSEAVDSKLNRNLVEDSAKSVDLAMPPKPEALNEIAPPPSPDIYRGKEKAKSDIQEVAKVDNKKKGFFNKITGIFKKKKKEDSSDKTAEVPLPDKSDKLEYLRHKLNYEKVKQNIEKRNVPLGEVQVSPKLDDVKDADTPDKSDKLMSQAEGEKNISEHSELNTLKGEITSDDSDKLMSQTEGEKAILAPPKVSMDIPPPPSKDKVEAVSDSLNSNSNSTNELGDMHKCPVPGLESEVKEMKPKVETTQSLGDYTKEVHLEPVLPIKSEDTVSTSDTPEGLGKPISSLAEKAEEKPVAQTPPENKLGKELGKVNYLKEKKDPIVF